MIRSRPWIWIAGSLAAALLVTTSATSYFSSFSSKAASVQASPDRVIAVHSLGRLEPQSRVLRLAPPSSAMNARIERLHVKEGDIVSAGTPLATLDSYDRLHAALEEAEAKLVVSRARLEQVKSGAKPAEIAAHQAMTARAEVALSTALREMQRAESLWLTKSIGASEYDQRRTDWEKARHEADQAKANLDATKHVRDVDIRVAEAEVVCSLAAQKRARRDLEAAEIRMPVTGSILKIHTYPGEVVGSKGIMEVGDVSAMYAVAQVYEADLMRLQIADKAEVRVASSNQVIHGAVEEIGRIVGRKDVLDNDPVSDTDARVVEVRIRLDCQDLATIASLSNARVHVTIQPRR